METKNLKYAIIGATGNIGKRIAESLIKQAKEVRVIARHAEQLEGLSKLGAKAYPADANSTAALREVFTGVDAVFTMVPPNYTAPHQRTYSNKISEALGQAIENSGVKYVVNLSSIGADRAEGHGPVNGLYDNEQRLNRVPGLNIIHVRAAYFMENHLRGVDMIKKMGFYGGPIKADARLAMIATQDIATRAAELLSKLDFQGQSTQDLLGAGEYTCAEVTSVFGKAIGKPDLKYVEFSYVDAENTMKNMGLSADFSAGMIELQRSINEGNCKPTETRSPRNTTQTTIEKFAQVFAAAYGSK